MWAWIKRMLGNDAPPIVQFMKYGAVGVLVTLISMIVFYTCAVTLFPCLTADDKLVTLCGLSSVDIPDAVRATRAVWCNIIGFVVANIVCYMLNRMFIFKPGRHGVWLEFILFFSGSALSVCLGSGVIWLLIKLYAIQTTFAAMINIAVSLSLNFVTRKFFIFKH